MKITIDNFKDFISGSYDYDKEKDINTGLWLREEHMDIGGGKIKVSNIDILKQYPDVDTFTISGLNQDTFEYFIKSYGHQIRAIRFFKNKLVEDLSLLGTLTNLEFIYFFHNQRVTSLWDMSNNLSLKGIELSDFSRLHSIKGIEKAPNLQWFNIGNAIWDKAIIDSYKYFAGTSITHLAFSGRDIVDKDLSFLSQMNKLKTFDFPTNLLSTEQIAWIVSNFPYLSGFALKPYREYEFDKDQYVIITGKRKPYIIVKGNESRIEKYKKEFYLLVEKYKGLSYDQAFCE